MPCVRQRRCLARLPTGQELSMSRSWTAMRNDLVVRSDGSTSGTASRPLGYSIVHAEDKPRVLGFLRDHPLWCSGPGLHLSSCSTFQGSERGSEARHEGELHLRDHLSRRGPCQAAEFYETIGLRRGKEDSDRVTFVNWFSVTRLSQHQAEGSTKGAGPFLYTKVDDIEKFPRAALSNGLKPAGESERQLREPGVRAPGSRWLQPGLH
jgi:hypothetical protein